MGWVSWRPLASNSLVKLSKLGQQFQSEGFIRTTKGKTKKKKVKAVNVKEYMHALVPEFVAVGWLVGEGEEGVFLAV